jgi:hypothetical protein
MDEKEIDVWTVPAISILTRLCFRMEGMTELINGTFIDQTRRQGMLVSGREQNQLERWIR